jgi:hypothetical protein
MSTPEERLKQMADTLRAQQDARERRAQEDEVRQRDERQGRGRVVSAEAGAWFNRAKEMIDATRMRIPVQGRYEVPGDDPGFSLKVGTAQFTAVLSTEGWRVVTMSPPELLPGGQFLADLAGVRETVLEGMVGRGLEDFIEGRVEPAPEWGR